MSSGRKILNKVRPYLAMVLLQFGAAGLFIISVASLRQGMNHYVLVVYRNAVAAAVFAPFALWFESEKERPKMTTVVFLKITALALIEPVIDQNLYYVGASATSASFAAALYNILPAVTFVLATVLRMEKIKIRSLHTQAKIAGTMVTLAGALLMILCKGPAVEFPWTKGRSGHRQDASVAAAECQDEGRWLMGTFMLLFSCLCWSCFFILQANTLKSYPAELSLTALICSMGALQSGAVAVAVERSVRPWIIGWDTRLLTVVYSGVVCSGIAYYIQGVVMRERGPVFVTAFNPLCMIIVAVLGSIILAEEITLGRVVGAAIIVVGLYAMLWGKGEDQLNQSEEEAVPVASADVEAPAARI